MDDTRPDGHSWFKRWPDALGQANRRAALIRRRYRVFYDPANRWWNIAEAPSTPPDRKANSEE